MNIIFMGTPDFSVPTLDRLYNSRHNLLCVISQPDRLGNRNKLILSPVKQYCTSYNIPIYQYNKVSREGVDTIKNLKPDVIVTAAFGQILSREILAIPKYGVINVHASLLPKYRGASPIQSAILSGDKETGVTIMKTEYEVDSGDIIAQQSITIGESDTAGDLFDKLSKMGADTLLNVLDNIENDKAVYTPQDSSKATFCKMFSKASGRINFDSNYYMLNRFINAMMPWPSAFTYYNGKMLKIFSVTRVGVNNNKYEFGTVVTADKHDGFTVAVKDSIISVNNCQQADGKRMSGRDFILGNKIPVGTILGKDE